MSVLCGEITILYKEKTEKSKLLNVRTTKNVLLDDDLM